MTKREKYHFNGFIGFICESTVYCVSYIVWINYKSTTYKYTILFAKTNSHHTIVKTVYIKYQVVWYVRKFRALSKHDLNIYQSLLYIILLSRPSDKDREKQELESTKVSWKLEGNGYSITFYSAWKNIKISFLYQ